MESDDDGRTEKRKERERRSGGHIKEMADLGTS